MTDQTGITHNVGILSVSNSSDMRDRICTHLGIKPIVCQISKFSSGESHIGPVEDSLRGKHVYIIWTPDHNINDQFMECLLLIQTCKKASAKEVRVLTGAFPYARQDKKHVGRVPISAEVVAKTLEFMGVTSIMAFELHNDAIQGFPSVPLDNLIPRSLYLQYITQHIIPTYKCKTDDIVIVAPDIGATTRARKIADGLGCGLVTIVKRRYRPNDPDAVIMELNGDVSRKICIIIDDMADTSGTLCKAADILTEAGAKEKIAIITHGIFSGDAVKKIEESQFSEVISTNSVNAQNDLKRSTKIKRIDMAPLLAKAVKEMEDDGSVSNLFEFIVDDINKLII
jgi:ribose-phosphate pyrophosphokinase